MSESVIKVEGIYKKFCTSLKRSMLYGTSDVCRNMLGFPARTDVLRKGEYWALNNIDFELRRGETLGIIGRNGSGKSTLLRLLTGIFPPDRGTISVKGKLGALIAVGAGFHPHMTGKENIYLNGTILGMSKKEIDSKFDRIVAFAETGDFLEAPINTYSSGMKVRLGFAIAIHCDLDILLVDEILSVGDMEFRAKCIKKINEITSRTSVIFISHNMYQIQRLCDRLILLDHGVQLMTGDVDDVIVKYNNLTGHADESQVSIITNLGWVTDLEIVTRGVDGSNKNSFDYGDDIVFEFSFKADREINNPVLGFNIQNSEGTIVACTKNIHYDSILPNLYKGSNKVSITLKDNNLLPGVYNLYFKWKTMDNYELIEATSPKFKIEANRTLTTYDGLVKMNFEWQK